MLRFGVVALTLAVFSSNAFAYPIFYACSADGRLREFVNTKELETLVLSSTDEEVMNKRLKVLCGGIYECFAVLKQALMLTKANIQINNQILEAEVRALVEKKGAELNQSIDPALPTTARNLMEMAQDIQACRKAQEDLPEDSFRLYDPRFGNPKYGDGGLILQNRLDNEYRFVSGEEGQRYKDSTGKRNDVKLPLDIVRTVIDTAIAGGVDPYVALAVTQWEERNFDRHYTLDYRPMMKMLGCELKRKLECKPYSKENGDALSAKYENLGQPFVYEYDGCVYGFDPKVRESNPEFLETLDRYLMARSQRNDEDFAFPKRSPSLYCVQADGGFLADAQTGRFLASGNTWVDPSKWSVNKACCRRVPYGVDAYDTMTDILATLFMKERLSVEPTSKLSAEKRNRPEYRIQSFNGLTDMMGKGERGTVENPIVGGFRLGLNNFETPQYGLQAMDLILNTYMSNPAVRALVKDGEARAGKVPKSVLCMGKSAGAYGVDSEYYAEKQKQGKRFASLIGQSWEGLSRMHQSIIEFEWGLMTNDRRNRVLNSKLSLSENEAYWKLVDQMNSLSSDSEKWSFYQSKIYPKYRQTLYQASRYTWDYATDEQVLKTREKVWRANGL